MVHAQTHGGETQRSYTGCELLPGAELKASNIWVYTEDARNYYQKKLHK